MQTLDCCSTNKMSEQGDKRESIPKQSKQITLGLSRCSENVTTVAEAVKKSYTDLPTSEKAVGLEHSKALTEAREQMTKRLALYREFHLPLSIALVNDLVRTLDYFKNDFAMFKPLLPFVQKQVKEAEERAESVHEMYIALSMDLSELGEDAQKALKAAEIAAKINFDSANNKGKLARDIGIGGTSVGAGVVAGGFLLACSLTGPGGLLFAPALAIPAFLASSTVAVVGASGTAIAAKVLKDQSNQEQIIANVLKESGLVYETVLVVALKQFADCMNGFANFFQSISNELKIIDSNMSDLDNDSEFSDKELRALYDMIRRESDGLRKACTLYLAQTSGTKVALGVLDRFENENYMSYIDEWYNAHSSQMKQKPFSTSFLKKVVPRMKALHW